MSWVDCLLMFIGNDLTWLIGDELTHKQPGLAATIILRQGTTGDHQLGELSHHLWTVQQDDSPDKHHHVTYMNMNIYIYICTRPCHPPPPPPHMGWVPYTGPIWDLPPPPPVVWWGCGTVPLPPLWCGGGVVWYGGYVWCVWSVWYGMFGKYGTFGMYGRYGMYGMSGWYCMDGRYGM